MFPSKNVVDYITEMNRLFPRNSENELSRQLYGHPAFSPLNHSIMGQSSSSADSTSPESYLDISPPFRPYHPPERSISDTPIPKNQNGPIQDRGNHNISRQRAIIGRKIFTTSETQIEPRPPHALQQMEIDQVNIWTEVMQQDALRNLNMLMDNKNHTHNVFYELFPADRRGIEFKTPVKIPQNMTHSDASPSCSVSPNMTNMSPIMASMSPNMVSMSLNVSSMSPNIASVSPTFPNLSPVKYASSPVLRHQFEIQAQKMCTFCKKNGETPIVYMTHSVKEKLGNRHLVTCPILRSHVCSTCGATGDYAHTITYCPVVRSSNNGRPVPSTTITLKSTRVKSNGRRRY